MEVNLDNCSKYFPLLKREVHGKPIIYLDSAATSIRPQSVIDAVVKFYTQYSAGISRAVHILSEEATEAFETSRDRIAHFINADSREIAFMHNATQALNVVAASELKSGLVMHPLSEHHSNLLPWRRGEVMVLPVSNEGRMDVDASKATITQHKPKILALSTISNALGVRHPVHELTQAAHSVGARVILDVSQSVGHEVVDMQDLDCDYACFSGHKMFGPNGLGVLYRKEGIANDLEPLIYGGSMVHAVHEADFELRPYPWNLEAGSPNVEAVVGLVAACDFIEEIGLEAIHQHCNTLTQNAREKLSAIPGVTLHGAQDKDQSSIISFSVEGTPANGVARILSNRFNIMVRSGYHCAQPLHEACGIPETVRASVHVYNTLQDIEHLVEAVGIISKMGKQSADGP